MKNTLPVFKNSKLFVKLWMIVIVSVGNGNIELKLLTVVDKKDLTLAKKTAISFTIFLISSIILKCQMKWNNQVISSYI